jgi:arylsulfatase A-like enzyme
MGHQNQSIAVLAALLCALGCSSADDADPLRPRPGAPVVLISIDTLRADRLGAYGNTQGLTPNLDAFAREALVFEQCWSAANNTGPSHMTIMTGLLPDVHGIRHGYPSRPAEAVSMLADELRQAGWLTSALADGAFVTRAFGFDRGFDRFVSRLQPFSQKLPTLLQWAAEGPRAPDGPRMLFVHTYEPHSPYVPTIEHDLFTDPDYDGQMRPIVERIRVAVEDPAGRLNLGDLERSFWPDRGTLDEADVRYLRGLYDGDVLQADDGVGQLLDALAEHGWYDEAWIFIVSDHGEAFREHGTYEHRQLFSEELSVPLMVRPPGGVRGGARTDMTARLLDVAPTILHAVGLASPELVQGRSLLPLGERVDRPVYSIAGESDSYRVFQIGTHKLHWRGPGKSELYDLAVDPAEQDDLAQSSLRPSWASNATAAMKEIEAESAALRRALGEPGSVGTIDPQVLDELRQLGYLSDR